MWQDYESWGAHSVRPNRVPVLEAYAGDSVTYWYYRIKNQLQNMVTQLESDKNYAEAAVLREYYNTWSSNPLDGSINVETLQMLSSSAAILAADTNFKNQNYFQNLQAILAKVVASEQMLPRDGDQQPPKEDPGMGVGGPPPASFGPEKDAPPPGTNPGEEPENPDENPDANPEPGEQPEDGEPGIAPDADQGEPGPEDEENPL